MVDNTLHGKHFSVSELFQGSWMCYTIFSDVVTPFSVFIYYYA